MNEYSGIIRENIGNITEKIRLAAERSGRNPQDITIIAVTKTIEPERIKTAIDTGLYDLGENRVQELCEKYDNIDRACRWHLIGHLQTNKVKYIIDKIHMIHSVDRLELAQEIQKRAERAGRVINVLVQVNVAKEETKFGIHEEQVIELVKNLSYLGNIKVKGLMTIAPFTETSEEVRHIFRGLRKLLIDIRGENIDNIDMDFLSMGMSNDFEVAVEEGSNMVRIGTAIFGHRQK